MSTRMSVYCSLEIASALVEVIDIFVFNNIVSLIKKASAKRKYERVIKNSTIEIRDTELRNLLIQELLVNGEEVVKNIFDLGKRLYFGYEVQR